MESVRYMISDAAKRIDVEPHVLRYWEDELAVEIPRNEMGHRYYREEEISMMKGVKYLKERGFQLKSIKILLPDIKKVMALEPRRLLELRDRLELAVSQEELRLQREEELRQCEEELRGRGQSGQRGEEKANALERKADELEGKANALERKADALEGKDDDPEGNSGEPEKKFDDPEGKSNLPIEKADILEGKGSKKKDADQGKERNRKQEKKDELQNYSGGNVESQGADKLLQFRRMMNEIILDAMSENNRLLNDSISESFSRELEYQMRRKELQEEERYKQLDRTLREYQQGQKQAAVAKEYSGKRRKSKFFKKNKVRI